MELTVEGLRGILQSTTVELSDKITLFTGPNGSGKSSMLQALQTLVTREKMPVPDLKQKDAALIVNDQTKTAKAALKYEGGTIDIKWPSCKMSGPEFNCSVYAAGWALPVNIPPKHLTAIIGVLPSREDFDAEVAGMEHLDLPADDVWNKIATDGWDNTHAYAVETGKNLKRDWERMAGTSWLPANASNWVPEHWTGKPIEELEQAERTAQKLFEHAMKSQGVSEKERADLQILADDFYKGVPQQKINELNAELNTVNTQLSKAQAALEAIPRAVNPGHAYECWNCKAMGVIKDGALIQAPDVKVATEDAQACKQRIDEQGILIGMLQENRDSITLKLKEARIIADRSEQAHKRVNTLGVDPEPDISADDARAELQLCQQRIQAHKVKIECDETAAALHVNTYLQAVLCPEGLRKIVAGTKLESFNGLLASICEQAEWPLIQLDEFLDVRFNNRPYVLASPGEKFAVNACLQIAIATLDKSELLIIDGVDLLDDVLRYGLITVLDNLQIPSVIGCKFTTEDQAPDLAEHGLGLTYWCGSSTVKPVRAKAVA